MVRVVLDTVVFVRALINPQNRHGRLVFDRADEYVLVLSKEIAREILEVVSRPKLVAKSPSFARVNFESVLKCFSHANVVECGESVDICRDPEDNKFLECAISGHAVYVVSEDRDLLDIKEYRGVRIVSCEEFLRELDRR